MKTYKEIPYYEYSKKKGQFTHKLNHISPKLLAVKEKAVAEICPVLKETTSPFRDEFPGIILN